MGVLSSAQDAGASKRVPETLPPRPLCAGLLESLPLRQLLICGLAFSSLARAQAPIRDSLATDFRSFGQAGSKTSLYGAFVRHSDTVFVIQLPDARVLRIRLKPETAAFKGGAKVSIDSYEVGDSLRVEAVADGRDNLDALTIDLLRKGTLKDRADIVQTPEWRRGDTLHAKAIDPTNDRRRLSTFIQTLPQRSLTTQPATGATELILQKAREWVRSYLSELPNFIAQQDTEEFLSTSDPPQWISNGRVDAVLRHENGRDAYSGIVIDGAAKSDFPQDSEAIPSYLEGKAWSSGEFGGTIACMFSPYSKTDFRYERTEGPKTSEAYVFTFTLPKLNACNSQRHGSQVVYPGSKGMIWISGADGSLLKLQLQYLEIPSAFPVDKVEREIEFGLVRIGENAYRMPVKGYYFGCMRGTYYCWMNRINFADYKQFTSESTIQFAK
jgi:hypothetical protein